MYRSQAQEHRSEQYDFAQNACPEAETLLLIATGLHDLCQPLTALQCRLEIGLLNGSRAAITSAVREALAECVRLNEYVRAMQISLVERQRTMRGQR